LSHRLQQFNGLSTGGGSGQKEMAVVLPVPQPLIGERSWNGWVSVFKLRGFLNALNPFPGQSGKEEKGQSLSAGRLSPLGAEWEAGGGEVLAGTVDLDRDCK
jgi:hypothetical protein